MKNLSAFLVCLIMIISVSCKKDEVNPHRETGYLQIGIGLSIHIHEVSSKLKSLLQTEDFKVTIYKADGTEVMSFESASDMPDAIELETGNYYVEAHSDNNLPAAFENPYYLGVSNVFTINNNTQHSVLVNCELANTIVTVIYSDNVVNSFSDYTATVSSELGSLVFTRNETRMGYFQTLPLEIMAELTYLNPDGSDASKELSGSIPDPLPNKHYEILVDASIDGGVATFQIQMDPSEVAMEVVEITDNSNTPQNGAIGFGELLITEIMPNPSALSDTEGEWFEIYNNSDRVINLQNLILGRDDANRHTISESIDLSPGSYIVIERTDLATGASGYTYGSGILLPNTGAVLSIFNEGTETEPGALVFSVDYGGTAFPNVPGASISLSPDLINAGDAVRGTSWCLSISVYSTGDLGTPGAVNDSCQ
jgi:hypothetical protein